MAFVSLEDMVGTIEALIFPKVYEKHKQHLVEDSKVFLRGCASIGDDPVGNYGKGVRQAADAFGKAGMKHVSVRVYPLCRHEILNEINRVQVYQDVLKWIEKYL